MTNDRQWYHDVKCIDIQWLMPPRQRSRDDQGAGASRENDQKWKWEISKNGSLNGKTVKTHPV